MELRVIVMVASVALKYSNEQQHNFLFYARALIDIPPNWGNIQLRDDEVSKTAHPIVTSRRL